MLNKKLTINQIDKNFNLFLENIKKNKEKTFNINLILKAYEFAKQAHKFQKRKTGEPYINHPLEVAKLIYDVGLDTSSIIAAFLHDVVEDTNYSLKQINQEFGEEIEILVDGLTKIKTFTENREEKNIEVLRKILLASAKDIRVLVIKLCDRLHNLRTLEELNEKKQKRIATNSLLIYAPLAQKIGMYSLKWELEDLAFKYKNPEMYYLIKKKIKSKRNQREKIVKKAVNEIIQILNLENSKDIYVIGRPKNFYSIYKKIKDQAKSFEEIYDLYAIRIITKNISQCYTLLGMLHENFQAFPNRLKDYIANPKANGYQSIHTTIFSRKIKSPVEIQIRTENMHKLAEYGIAAHWKYKNLKEDKRFEKKISWLREVLQWEKEHKNNQEFLHLLKYDFFEDEIFVFTPKNKLIFLAQGSIVLDFAYAVHTEIGEKTYKAKINGILSPIDKTLKNGDIVEIITNKKVKPNEKWLKIVKTSKAKIKIRDKLNLKFKKSNLKKPIDEITFETLKNKISRINEFKKVRKARCCKIDYADQIVGVLIKGKELVIHNASCDNAKYTLQEKIALNWIEEKDKQIELEILLKDKLGLLIDVLNILEQFNLSVLKLNSKILKDAKVKMTLKIKDGPYIKKLINKLKKLDSVENIKINDKLF